MQSVGKEIPDQARKKMGGEGRKEKSSKTQVSKYVGNEAVFCTHARTYPHTLTHTFTHARRSTARRPEDRGSALRLRLRTEARSGAC